MVLILNLAKCPFGGADFMSELFPSYTLLAVFAKVLYLRSVGSEFSWHVRQHADDPLEQIFGDADPGYAVGVFEVLPRSPARCNASRLKECLDTAQVEFGGLTKPIVGQPPAYGDVPYY